VTHCITANCQHSDSAHAKYSTSHHIVIKSFLLFGQLLNTDRNGGCDQHCRQLSEVYDTHRRTKLTGWQRLRQTAIPETWLCPPKFKWFT